MKSTKWSLAVICVLLAVPLYLVLKNSMPAMPVSPLALW